MNAKPQSQNRQLSIRYIQYKQLFLINSLFAHMPRLTVNLITNDKCFIVDIVWSLIFRYWPNKPNYELDVNSLLSSIILLLHVGILTGREFLIVIALEFQRSKSVCEKAIFSKISRSSKVNVIWDKCLL